jgi:disulfide bond formation protein DsbB
MAEAIAAPPSASAGLSSPAFARLLAVFVPAALLAGAFGSEYIGHLTPCEMCWWQRYAHLAALVPAALAFTAPAPSGRARALVLLAALAIAVSGAIGFYQAGVERHIFEGFTTCTSTAHGTSTADLLKQIMAAPLIRCDEIQWSWLGISMAGWNAIVSLGSAALIVLLSVRARRV